MSLRDTRIHEVLRFSANRRGTASATCSLMRMVFFAALVAIGCSNNNQSSTPHTVACGDTTCDLATDVCCVSPDGGAVCTTGTICGNGLSTFGCDDPSDCPSDKVCCGEVVSPFFDTSCLAPKACGSNNTPIICKSSSDCTVDGGGTTCLPGETYGPISLETCQ
jgi:hypothetical protein